MTRVIPVCPICQKPKDKRFKINTDKGDVPLQLENLCVKCVDMTKSSVNLFCDKCSTYFAITEKQFSKWVPDIKNGEVISCKECPKCSKKFTF